MKIVSQRRTEVVEFENLYIQMRGNGTYYHPIRAFGATCKDFIVGGYETYERSEEVFEEILTAYQNGEVVFYMPEE